jgi:hypothetical protein
MPALLTSTETGPKASSAAATVAARSLSLVTSRRKKTAELAGKRPPLPLKHVRNHDVRALGDEPARVARTQSAGASRDDHCPIIETFHD